MSVLRRCVVCHTAYPGSERFCPLDGGAIVEEQPGATGTRIGQTIDGRYLVRRLLGRGGMGEVYAADHVGLDKQVAIKFVTSDNSNPNALARFRREARVASKIVHEHVVQIYDVGADRGVDYIVMEYLEGKDLKQVLAESGALPVSRAVSIARQMLSGLAAIHDAEILHRDIKPANVLLAKRAGGEDFVKIMDFGISRAARGTEDGMTLTGTGNVIGTPEYIAPEVLRGAPVDHRADLYAVGVTLHAMLAGAPPFVATAFERIVAMHLSEPPPRLAGVPPYLADAVLKSLAKEPAARFADARAFAKALEPRAAATIVDDTAPLTVPGRAGPLEVTAREGEEPRKRSRAPLVAGAIAVVLVGGGLAAFLATRGGGDAQITAQKLDAAPGSAATAVDAAQPLDQVLELAREKETENPVLAIALYDDAFKRAPSAQVAMKLGDLSVMVDRRPEALAYYRKFLELASPGDPAHDTVAKRVAELAAPPVDAAPDDAALAGSAGSGSGSTLEAGSGGSGGSGSAAPLTIVDEHTPYCRCDDGPRLLCAPPGQPYCMCVDGIDPLCPAGMGPHDTCDANPKFANYALMPNRRLGQSCSGYAHYGGIAHNGSLDCKQCDPTAYLFRGQSGDACTGIGATDGVKSTGRLSCRPAP